MLPRTRTLLTSQSPTQPPTIPPDPLRKLHDLDRASPEFPKQLVDFLRGHEYRSVVPGLQGKDLTWFVEYLDNVSSQTISPHSNLNTGIGSRQHFGPYECRVPKIPTRTQKDLWRQGRSAEIIHDCRSSSGNFAPRRSYSNLFWTCV